jgi:hypothetical protein
MSFHLSFIENAHLSGDRIILPASLLPSLVTFPSPLTFRLSCADLFVFCSVRQFTAIENHIEISHFLANHLRIVGKETKLLVEIIKLEKGTKVGLRGLSAFTLTDPRSHLEAYLRLNFTTITVGAILEVAQQQFLVETTEPDNGILCIDTDLEVDLLPFKGEILTLDHPKWINNNLTLNLNTCTPLFFYITFTEGKNYSVMKKTTKGDIDIFISDVVEHPTSIDHTHLEITANEGTVVFAKNEFLHGLNGFNIGLYPYDGETDFTIIITAFDEEIKVIEDENLITAFDEEIKVIKDENSRIADQLHDSKTCSNCLQQVPSNSYDMHVAFCLRNNKICPTCHKIFNKEQILNHYHCDKCKIFSDLKNKTKHEYWHKPLKCSCDEIYEVRFISRHKKTCAKR